MQLNLHTLRSSPGKDTLVPSHLLGCSSFLRAVVVLYSSGFQSGCGWLALEYTADFKTVDWKWFKFSCCFFPPVCKWKFLNLGGLFELQLLLWGLFIYLYYSCVCMCVFAMCMLACAQVHMLVEIGVGCVLDCSLPSCWAVGLFWLQVSHSSPVHLGYRWATVPAWHLFLRFMYM